MLYSNRCLSLTVSSSLSPLAVRQVQVAYEAVKSDLSAAIEALEALRREMAAQGDIIGSKERAATAEKLELIERHKEVEESFSAQRDALNGHISGIPRFPSSILSVRLSVCLSKYG